MRQPTYPIFVLEGHDMSVYLDPKEIEGDLEHDDVRDNIFHGYDFNGRPLGFMADEDNTVHCFLKSDQPEHAQLMDAVYDWIDHLKYTKVDRDNPEAAKAIITAILANPRIERPTLWKSLKSLFIKPQPTPDQDQ